MTALRAGAVTDVGRVRTQNEDAHLVATPLFAVADGMGGHAAGEVASHTAVESLAAAFSAADEATAEGLAAAVQRANLRVWQLAQEDPGRRGMGTTLAAAALVHEGDDEVLAVVNVGDSRVYLFRDGELSQITEDHSLVEELVRSGRISAEEAHAHPQRHVVTRALGMGPEVDVDVFPIVPYRGDRLVLASDGLFNDVADEDIARLLRRVPDPEQAASQLTAMAKTAGGSDNITVVVVDVVDDDDRAGAASAALAHEGTGPSQPTVREEPTEATEAVRQARAPESEPSEPLARSRRTGAEPRARRLTVRVVLFVVALLAVLGGVGVAVGFYARASYFVGLQRGQVTIFQGRPGGLLWFRPTVAGRTGLSASDVPSDRAAQLRDGKLESSLAAARRYVVNLRNEVAAQRAAGSPTSTSTSAPAPAP